MPIHLWDIPLPYRENEVQGVPHGQVRPWCEDSLLLVFWNPVRRGLALRPLRGVCCLVPFRLLMSELAMVVGNVPEAELGGERQAPAGLQLGNNGAGAKLKPRTAQGS